MSLKLIGTPTAILQDKPQETTEISANNSQLLFGEGFQVTREQGDWLEGKSEIDGYQGFIQKSHMQIDPKAPTHFVDVRQTHAYPRPDFKTKPEVSLSFLSRLHIDDTKTENGFILVPNMGWIYESHIQLLSRIKPTNNLNLAEIALQFLHTPYLYGGRSCFGIDCSGLVQLCLLRFGYPCPRDSYEQALSFKKKATNHHTRQRGELVFFKGHVGIMVDKENIVNASARTMSTLIENLHKVEQEYNGITSIARIF